LQPPQPAPTEADKSCATKTGQLRVLQTDGGEGVGRELVVAGGEAPEVFRAAECRFDRPALAVAPAVVADRPLPVDPARDDRCRAGIAEGDAEPVRIVAAIG